MTRIEFLRRSHSAIISSAVAAAVIASAGALTAAPTITNLGVISDEPFAWSLASGVSADGAVVVGSASIPGDRHAFRWTSATGMQDLGILPDGFRSDAFRVSADGSVIIGSSEGHDHSGSPEVRAFRWTSAGGMQDVGALPGGLFNYPIGVSSDGSIIIGESRLYGGVLNPFRWTAAGGMQPLGIGTLPGGAWASPTGLSGDGAIVVGNALNVASGGGVENLRAFRWTSSDGMQDLGTLPGGLFSQSSGVSADGAVVVGSANPAGLGNSTYHAFRWTSAGGLQELGALPGGTESSANAASGNGSAIVGESTSLVGYHAFLWTAALGMVDLNTYLPSLGVNLSGWELSRANAISADGSAIVGHGYFNGDQRAWLVIGVPPALPGDFNRNGDVDAEDYVVWRNGLGTTYTQNDYNVWRAHFGQTAGSGAAGYPLGASAESLSATVPEPSSITLFAIATIWITTRSRRSCGRAICRHREVQHT